MVLKHNGRKHLTTWWFENDVKIYGIKTREHIVNVNNAFENDVKIYGIKTLHNCDSVDILFENDVKIYGIKTIEKADASSEGLRMM